MRRIDPGGCPASHALGSLPLHLILDASGGALIGYVRTSAFLPNIGNSSRGETPLSTPPLAPKARESEYAMAKGQKPDYEAFISKKSGDKNFYTKIGAAWSVAGGGVSVQLDALPVDGKFVLFLPKEDG